MKKNPSIKLNPLSDKLKEVAVETEPLFEAVRLRTPLAYFSLGRSSSSSDWKDVSKEEKGKYQGDYVTVSLDAHVESKNMELLRKPILLNGLELPRGVVAIVGAPRTGKTEIIERLLHALTSASSPVTVATMIYREPLEAGRISARHPISTDVSLLEGIARFLVGANVKADVLLIDSLSAYSFAKWSDWSTAKYGLNTGLPFWLTDLHNAAVKCGKTIIVSFNPGIGIGEIVEGLSDLLTGRVGGVIMLTDYMRGQYTYRSSEGERDQADVFSLFSKLPGRSSGPISVSSSFGDPSGDGIMR